MGEQRRVKAELVVFAVWSLFTLSGGVTDGLDKDWVGMTKFLFLSVLFLFFLVNRLLMLKLGNRLSRLEDRLQIDRKPRSSRLRRLSTAVETFMILLMLLLFAAATHDADWFRLGMHLTACAFIVIVWQGVSAATVIGTHLTWLEQLPAGTRKAENA